MSVADRVLAVASKKRHDELCRAVSKDLPTFIRVGSYLIELRELEVYKATHKTFETFVLEQFSLERAQAYRLMDAADVSKNICLQIGDTTPILVPQRESQLREVAKAPPEKQAEVVRKAAEKAAEENRKPTAADYKKVVGELLLEGESVAESVPAPNAPPVPRPPEHHPKEMAGPLMAHVSTLTKMLNDLKKRKDERGGEWIDVQAISTQVSALKYSLKSSIYCADCPACHGERCEKCKQTGFLPELKSAVVDGTK